MMIRFNGVNHLAMAQGVLGATIRFRGGLDGRWRRKDRLEAAGFHVSDVIDHGFIHSIYSFDPNGIPIEFSHNVEGIDVRRNPSMRDSGPSRVSREGAEPQAGEWPA